MMARRAPTRILIILVLIAGLALLGWLVLRPVQKPFATLPNGLRIKIEGVTFGTNHIFTTDSKLTRTLRMILPGSLQRFLPAPWATTETTTEPQALIYLSAFDPASRTYGSPWRRFEIIDEHGCIWPVRQWSNSSRAPTFLASTIHAAAFPRRARDFTLRVYVADSKPVDLRVPNRVKGPFPKWTAEPLPARRSVGDLTFELRDIRARWSTNNPNSLTPVYAVFRNGLDVTPEWRAIMNLCDETGNRGDVLCPYEEVWKVELKFLKTAKASFPADQIWRIPSVTVPDDGRAHVFNQSQSLSNIQVQLIALAGRGDFKFSNGVLLASSPWKSDMSDGGGSSSGRSGAVILQFSGKEPALVASITNLVSPDDLLIRARDLTGRVGEARFVSNGNYYYRFVLSELKAGSSVDLELIRQEPITVEFSVRPPSPPGLVTKP